MGSPFVWHELQGADTAAARKFYENLLGWDIQEVPGPDAPMTMIGGAEPWAGIAEDGAQPAWVPYVRVEDVAAATSQAKKLGATIVRDKTRGPAGEFSVVTDPAGARIALWQPAE